MLTLMLCYDSWSYKKSHTNKKLSFRQISKCHWNMIAVRINLILRAVKALWWCMTNMHNGSSCITDVTAWKFYQCDFCFMQL